MNTGPGIAIEEPISAEVAKLDEQELHALDRLRTQVRALEVAAKAEGIAGAVLQHATAKSEQLGERIAVLESDAGKRDLALDKLSLQLGVLDERLGVLDERLDVMNTRSPLQQFIYSTAAMLAAIYFGVLLYRIATGAG